MPCSQRRSFGVRLLSVVLVVGLFQPVHGSPGDVLKTDVPFLGSVAAPKAVDLKDGDTSVSAQTGAFQYSYPILLPPGRLGIQPALTLAYSSQAPHFGSVAAGWSLSLPEISRDPRQSLLEAQQPGYVPRYVSSMAGGQRLVPVTEPAAAGVTQTYRAQYDGSYARYERLSTAGQWRVRTTDGLTHMFGETDHIEGPDDVRRSPISRTFDGFGNTVHYYWTMKEDVFAKPVEHLLTRIEYTTNDAAQLTAHARVVFEYSDPAICNPDEYGIPAGARLEFRDGMPLWSGSRRLNSIFTEVRSGSTFRRVGTTTLTYDEAADDCDGRLHGPIRLLTGILQSAISPDGQSTTLPPVTFTYGPLTRNLVSQRGFRGVDSALWNDTISGGTRDVSGVRLPGPMTMLLDFDGDGRLDRLRAEPPVNGCRLSWERNTGTGFIGVGQTMPLPTLNWGSDNSADDCSLGGQLDGHITNRDNPTVCSGEAKNAVLSYRFLDMNADGLPDLVTAPSFDWRYYNEFDSQGPSLPDEWTDISCTPGPGACLDVSAAALQKATICEKDRYTCRLDQPEVDSLLGLGEPLPCNGLIGGPSTVYRETGVPDDDEDPRNPKKCERTPFERCGRYPWIVYWNQGGSFNLTNAAFRKVIMSPIPLESNAGDSSLGAPRGGQGLTSEFHAIIDLDGDGFLDIMAKKVKAGEVAPENTWWVYRGDGDGDFMPRTDGTPYKWYVPDGAAPSLAGSNFIPEVPLGDQGSGYVSGFAGVMDATADGLPDLAYGGSGDPINLFVNLGDGFRRLAGEGSVSDTAQPQWLALLNWSVTREATIDTASGGDIILTGTRETWISPLDFDGDGRLDLYSRPGGYGSATGVLYPGDGTGDVTQSTPLSAFDNTGIQRIAAEVADALQYRVTADFIDLDGDGVTDRFEGVSEGGNAFAWSSDPKDGKPMRLLNRVDNGGGGTIDVSYQASTNPAIDIVGTDDRIGMPTHTWVVESVRRIDAFGPTATTTYRYGSPVWNADDTGRYGFRGFLRTLTTSPKGAVTESVYDYTVDWSGRPVETAVYASAADRSNDRPDSIEQSTWQQFLLFNNQIRSFQKSDVSHWTCSNGQSRATCLASGPRRVETTTWLGTEAETDPTDPTLLYYPRDVAKKLTPTFQNGDRIYRSRHLLFSNPNIYRLRIYIEQTIERVSGSDVVRRQRNHLWTDEGLFHQRTTDKISANDERTEYRYGTVVVVGQNTVQLGLPAGRIKPEQFAAGGANMPRTTIAYDPYYVHQASVTNELGHITYTDHDLGTGELVATRGPNSVSCGSGCVEREATRTVIDGFGRPLQRWVTTEDSSDGTYREVMVERTTYFDDEQPRRERGEKFIDHGGTDITMADTTYDGFGRVHTKKEFRFEPGKVDPVDTFTYDQQGNLELVATADPSADDGSTVTYRYTFDRLDRITEVLRPDQTGVTWTYDGLSKTRREFVAPTNPQNPNDPASAGPEAETITTTDVYGRLVQVAELLTGSTYATTTYAYDANDNLRQVVNPNGITTTLTHDWVDRRTSITRGSRTWIYTYDRNDNLRTEVAPVPSSGQAALYTTSIDHDHLDRPTSRIGGPRALSSAQQTLFGQGGLAFTYDQGLNGLGRLTSATSPIYTRTYSHDARGNVSKDVFAFNLQPALGVAISDQREISRVFNALGSVVEQVHGDDVPTTATRTRTNYNRRGQPHQLIWQRTVPVLLATATHSGAGFPMVIANDVVTQPFAYDELGRVTSMKALTGLTEQIAEAFTYYGTDDPATLTTSRAGLPAQEFRFSYDDRHQLETATNGQNYEGHFEYLNDGRIAAATISAPASAPQAAPRNVTYTYGGVDPEFVTQLTSQVGAAPVVYWHDLSGNVISRDEDGFGSSQPYTFLYDGDDQLRRATDPDGNEELYYYDHNGQRILAVSRQPGGAITRVRLWLDTLEVEYSGTGTVQDRQVSLSLDRPVARIENLTTSRHLIHGHLDHLLGAFNPSGTALAVAFLYGPFGEVLAQSGPAPDYRRRFNGKEQDQVTGLSYYGFRYFDPLSLTWTQADPLYRFAPDLAWDQPRRMNLYAFALNNATRYIDYDGKSPFEDLDYLSKPQNDGRNDLQRSADRVGGRYVQRQIPAAAMAAPLVAPGALVLAYATITAAIVAPAPTARVVGVVIGALQAENPAELAVAVVGGVRVKNPTIRSDVVLSGGRSGEKVKALVGPPNSVVKGGGDRAFVTNDKGQVVLDITSKRVKPVVPGEKFGPKRVPTPDELKLLNDVLGKGK